MAKIRKRNEEELKKEKEIEEELKEQRQTDKKEEREKLIENTLKGMPLVGVDLATGPDISVMIGGKTIKGVKEIKLDDNNIPTPIMKGHDPKSATLDSDEIKRLIKNTRKGNDPWLEHPDKAETTKRRREFENEYLNPMMTSPKGRHAKVIIADEMCNDQELLIESEIKRGEAQEAREKKREGCKKFQVHFTRQKYLSKDYAFDVYYKDLKIVDIDEPNFAEIMMNDPGDTKHIRTFKKILEIELRKRGGKFPLSLAMQDTILDDYIIGDL